ncbi:LLM class flavin-dependent oxidoreductase [soil metagenome]
MNSLARKPKFSVLDLSSIAQGQTAGDALKNTVRLAQAAEKLGYTRFWLAEHHNMDGIASSATAVVIGHVAGHTKTIRVGSGGIMLPNHAPLIIAEQFGTLESLYPGRIDLGLGRAPGSDQATSRAIRGGLESREMSDLVEELMFYFAVPTEGQKIVATPGAGLHVPIWLLGSSLYSAQLAGLLGLPYSFASHFAPELLVEALHVYRSHFRPSLELKEPYVMVGVQAVAAESDAEAEFLATSLYQSFLGVLRRTSFKLKPPVESMEGLWSFAEEEYVRGRFRLSARGGPEKIKTELLKMAQMTMADELIVTSGIFDQQKRLRSYEIIAQVLS